ncbi:thermonuclease family protein [Actinopolymorpha pittospori]
MLALAGCGADANDASAPNATPTETTSATPSQSPSATPTTTPTPAPQWLRVAGVVDGDTIKVETGGRVVETIRLIGLDTPETKKPGTPVQCFGPEASAYAKTLLDGKEVRIDQDSTQGATDKYGRTLAYVWLQDGRLVNEVMLEGGYGREYTYDKPYKYQTEFTAAQRKARDSKSGLWQSCVNTPKPKTRVEAAEPKPQPPAPKPKPPAPKPEPPAPKPEPPAPKPDLDPHFDTCKEANAHGYGPYRQGVDPEYDWYQDRDHDGLVCER